MIRTLKLKRPFFFPPISQTIPLYKKKKVTFKSKNIAQYKPQFLGEQ